MKVVPLSKAKTNLSHYARQCHHEPIVVTVNGIPSFQLVPFQKDDDLIDRLIEHNPAFRKLLSARLKEPSLTAKELARRLK